ncbi:MAG: bifunctional lysylphosphatidylglycerol flippase/synthetase MprF [Gudongella sp.]|nr:bifunctional lysylphosphatidylglycerol flippase/synthetase MprF [Gudongella sp.]
MAIAIKNFIKKHLGSTLKIIFFIFIIVFIFFSLKKEVTSIDFAETILLIRGFSIFSILFLSIVGLIAVSATTLYDFIIIKYLKLDLKSIIIFNVSFIASSINNISGLGGFTGASIRSIFFKKEDDNADIFDYNLLLLPATAVGLSVLILISLINYRYMAPIITQYKFLLFMLIGFMIYMGLYFFIDIIIYKFKKNDKDLHDKNRFITKLKLLIASILEWSLAYILFAIIIRYFNQDMNLYIILSIFALSSIAGVVSMLPGGVGSFDLVALVGFQYYGISSENILASLILFRVFYYFIPLIASIIITLIAQSLNKNSAIKLFNTGELKVFVNKTSNFTNYLLSILIFASGVILLFSALIPGITERIEFVTEFLSFPILRLSHQLSIVIGIILIMISRDISMKVKKAYEITWLLLLLGAIFTFLKGFDYEEATFLLVVLILLRASKDSFHRNSLPFDWYSTIIFSVIAFIGVGVYFRLSHLILVDFLQLKNYKLIFTKGFYRLLPNGIYIYSLVILYLIIKEVTKDRITKNSRYEEVDEDRIAKLFGKNGGSYLAHLVYLKDKHLFWSINNTVVIAFEKSHNIIVVLGDPIGNSENFGDAIEEFHEFIDSYGFKTAYYEISEKNLALYHEHGYNFFKLGETALVDLEDFDINSSKSRDFRNVLSRFKKDGYHFEIIDGSNLDDSMYLELLAISDEWLKGRNEMGFSVGFMDKSYIKKAPIALVRKTCTGEIIAFSSLMPKYDNNKSISIDLMRFANNVPSNAMTFLIINLMSSFKEQNYEILNLGVAPLSNVGLNQNAHLREKIAHLVFKYGKEIYSFGGLRQYKEKFSPRWESRYLAYEDLTLLPASIIEATILIRAKR